MQCTHCNKEIPEWLSIETAPKDGRTVDLWIVAKDCQFRATEITFYNGQWVRQITGEPLNIYYGNVGMRPTHWKFIPNPPIQEEKLN
ncbi:MAG: hypothetical protein KAS32_23870 [Candidatus Peribacteraceae bacterium]|nr:hypothetical protein [Candidatus Peribacteraceae bacterium]